MAMEDNVDHLKILTSFLVISLLAILTQRRLAEPNLSHIPTAGLSTFPFCYITALKIFWDAPKRLHIWAQRHTNDSAFKITDFVRWIVIVVGSQLIEELKSLPADLITFVDAHQCFEIPLDRACALGLSTKLTRNLPVIISEMRTEVSISAMHALSAHSSPKQPIDEDGWVSVPIVDILQEITSRVCNRVIVGPQLCQSTELTSLSKAYIHSTGLRLALVALLPPFASSVLLRYLSRASWSFWRLRRALSKVIKERRTRPQTQNHSEENARDLLSHLTTTSTSSDDIAHALLALNLRTIPFCSSTLTAALHRLAECDEGTVKTMRREIEAATYSEGWTTHSLAQMTKIDSFLKETMRLDGLNAITMQRITVAPYTFLDGTRIPEGTQLGVACSPVHLDASKYPSPNIFDPFRFVSGVGPRYNLTTASPDFLAWGLGYGACPGRFFAGAVMKLLLAHLVLLYDVRCEEGTEGKLPKIKWIGVHGAPYLKSSVLLRKRL